MSNQIYPETGAEFVKQEHARMLKIAQNGRLAASVEAPLQAPRKQGRSLRSLAFAVILVVVAGLAFAAIAFAAAGGGSGGGGTYLVM